MTFREEIEDKLQDFNREELVLFAWICGIRALPFLFVRGHLDFWKFEERQGFLYLMLRALDISYCFSSTTKTKNIVTKEEAKITIFSVNIFIGVAKIPASAAAYANVTTYTNSFTYAVLAAVNMRELLNEYIHKDILAIKNNKPFEASTKIYGTTWSKFQEGLKSMNCYYWAKIYQDLFDNNFQMDEEELDRRLNVPTEIKDQGAAAVANYLEELQIDTEILDEARIIILGEKGAGKTCLARRLVDPKASMTTDEESTAGVDTTSWRLDNLHIRIWDFAGHTVTHAVHRFFLSERCVYIMVYDGRTESRNRIEYWLDHMKNYGANSSAFILVNERDQHTINLPINNLKDKYNIIALDSFNLEEDHQSLKTFRQRIADFIQNNPSWKNQEIPKSHYEVKEALEKLFNRKDRNIRGKEYINKNEFEIIAQKHHAKRPEQLLKDLHALGISLWYKDMEQYNTLVLNPEWISHGVYTIINWTNKAEQYALTQACFTKVFEGQADRYPQNKYAFLYQLMQHYELAYEANDQETLIIPHLLPEDRPNQLPDFPPQDSLLLEFKSDQPLPPNIISRVIVRHNKQLQKDKLELSCWRHGAIFQIGEDTIALVRENTQRISIEVKGAERTPFITELRETIKDIFEDYRTQHPVLNYQIIDPIAGRQQPVLLPEQEIIALNANNRPYYDYQNNRDISVRPTIVTYNITNHYTIHGPAMLGGKGNILRNNTFNFKDCNVNLQGDLNYLSQLLKEKDHIEEAKELEGAAKMLKDIKESKTAEEVKEKGVFRRLKGIMEDFGDDKSKLSKAIKGFKRCVDVAQDIAAEYNKAAQWLGMPQVPKPFLKSDKDK